MRLSFWHDIVIRVRSVAGVGSQTSTHGRHTLNWALCGPCATVSCPQRPARVLCRVATRVARLTDVVIRLGLLPRQYSLLFLSATSVLFVDVVLKSE